MSKTNWEEVAQEYVTGRASLGELSRERGIPLATLKWHSRRENWVFLRRKHRRARRDVAGQAALGKLGRVVHDLANRPGGPQTGKNVESLVEALALIMSEMEPTTRARVLARMRSLLRQTDPISHVQPRGHPEEGTQACEPCDGMPTPNSPGR